MFRNDAIIITIIYGLVLAAFAISLKIGPVPVSLIDALATVTHPVWDSNTVIVWDLRLPRSIMCALVGGALALAGAALQSFLRNPLAEPSI
ncbi:MAG: iron chelate uptake ABC transporter family permease subunit, partial [Candidatus Puniceispirillum sp.]